MAELQRERLDAAGVRVVGVSQFRTTEAESIEFVEQSNLTFPNLYDPDAQVAEAYGVEGVPSYVFLDKWGRVAYRSSGANGVEMIEAKIMELLAEP